MTTPKVLMDTQKKGSGMAAHPERGWQAAAWLGGLLAVVGLGDFVLAFIPTAFGTPEWEFGTVASVFAGLPLPTLGLALLLGSAYARGKRKTVLALGTLLTLLAVIFGAMLVWMFLSNVPIALKSGAQGDVLLGLKKAIAKTTMLGVVFVAAYLVAGVQAIRNGLKH